MYFLIFQPKDILNSCLHFNEPQPKHLISTFLYIVHGETRHFNYFYQNLIFCKQLDWKIERRCTHEFLLFHTKFFISNCLWSAEPDVTKVLLEYYHLNIITINPFMHNVVKWPNILLKFCGVNIARFLKYVWPFYNIMHERVRKKTPEPIML